MASTTDNRFIPALFQRHLQKMSTTVALSLRLKTETASEHEHMHQLMAEAAPFASRERYARFVAAQYLFQRDIEHLFANPAVQAAIPDLSMRGRAEASLADLDDLGSFVPTGDIATTTVTMPEALGWIYVSEGSTLGAAFLLKEVGEKLGLDAGFGARNLAAYPEGRMRVWKRFVEALDAEALLPVQQPVVDGAHAAFRRFGRLLQTEFARSTTA